MPQPVCHFEIIGRDPAALRRYYGELFGWEYTTDDAATDAVSEPGNYGFVDASIAGLNGGVGGGDGYERRVLFYVRGPNLGARVSASQRPRGQRANGPQRRSGPPLRP